MKERFFCIGNAHLDPAWMWEWQEGSCEAKATIRSALDRMNEYPDFKFVCAGASVFEWIEEFDQSMFEEIKMRVREGRFILVGGWYVQPDCNIPSGEGFARQSLYSQRYFMEKFGVTAKVGYNVDSFGHNGNLPQILRKSGMNYYIFMRPMKHEKELESDVFWWESQDGSKVACYRIADRYCHRFENMDELKERLRIVSEPLPNGLPFATIFYGVGNHGGGPTKRHIELLEEYNNSHPGSVTFSTLSDMFDELTTKYQGFLPTLKDELQHHASGCYSAFHPIKDIIRKGETSLIASENLSILSHALLRKKVPTEEFKNAWKNLLFIHFHDICGGCCIKDAYVDALAFGNEAVSIATKKINNSVQSISWAVDTSCASLGTPVVVFNPHPFDLHALVKVNQRITSLHRDDEKISFQNIVSQTVLCGRRTDALIPVDLPALGYATYFINRDDAPHGIKFMSPEVRAKVDTVKHYLHFPTEVKYTKNSLEDDFFHIKFDTVLGYIVDIFDKKNQKHLLAPSAPSYKTTQKRLFKKKSEVGFPFEEVFGAVPVVIDESEHDTWSHGKNYFDKKIGYFADAKCHITEMGPLRCSIKIVSFYQQSRLEQTFSLSNDGLIRVHVNVDWHEKQKMLKLMFPFDLTETKSLYEIPFGTIVRPTNGEEECGQTWCAIIGKEGAVGMLNDRKYSFSMKNNSMAITAVRSPYFGDHGYSKYATEDTLVTDQGECEFNYALCLYDTNGEMTKRARLFNSAPVVVIENNHKGTLPLTLSGIHTNRPNIVISAIKISEDKNGLVLRAYETDGKKTTAHFDGIVLPAPLVAEFEPYSVETYYCDLATKTWRKTLLTEF